MMKREKREPKADDQKQVQYVFEHFTRLVKDNPEIEPIILISACWSILIDSYKNSGWTYAQFCEEIDAVKKHYIKWWIE
jgi:hypothetical protein